MFLGVRLRCFGHISADGFLLYTKNVYTTFYVSPFDSISIDDTSHFVKQFQNQ